MKKITSIICVLFIVLGSLTTSSYATSLPKTTSTSDIQEHPSPSHSESLDENISVALVSSENHFTDENISVCYQISKEYKVVTTCALVMFPSGLNKPLFPDMMPLSYTY